MQRNPDKVAYQPGEVVELTAVASAGWSFDGWSGDVVGMANPISVTMDADAVIAADFVQAPPVEYLLDVTATGWRSGDAESAGRSVCRGHHGGADGGGRSRAGSSVAGAGG